MISPGSIVRVIDYCGNTGIYTDFKLLRGRLGVSREEETDGRVYTYVVFGDDLEPSSHWIPWQNLEVVGSIFTECKAR